ncbi:hypothetical protein HRbin24_00312 [bacterium HR24]|jgi:uncharacterized protein YlxP (DUF503 family)|nr:hypothetical protein HRbin24_00312 [bacterium HR24]
MTVGLCRIWLRLPENHSLKGKRQAVRSLTSRLQNRFNVSVAEVDDHDLWQMVSIGISCVTNSERHAHEVLAAVVDYVRSQRVDMELVDYRTEVIHPLNKERF